MRIASVGHAVFAVIMIGLGTVGLLHPDFVPVWNPAPKVPGALQIVSLGALVSVISGIGLFIRPVAAAAARLLLATFLLWLVLLRLPNFCRAPVFEACWSVFPLAVMLAAAWALYVLLATDWDSNHLTFMSGTNGLRIARALYGFSLCFFGVAHFVDMQDTLSLIPSWLPAHLFWAYFTGCTFVAAGVATLAGVYARLAAALSAGQISLFLFLVWIPIVSHGSKDQFQWSETILNAALGAAAFVVADSYRDAPWLAIHNKS